MLDVKKINNLSSKLFLISIMVIPRSFILIKLGFLLLFILTHFLTIYRKNAIKISIQVFLFYCTVASAGVIWSLVGYINGGSQSGIIENLRLWFFWSFAYGLIVSILVQESRIIIVHKSIVIAGLLISIINLFEMVEFYNQLGLIPDAILTELDMRIGFHEGYIQVTSHNIGSLLFIVPYLIAFHFRKNREASKNLLSKLSLLLCIVLTVLSGRRALWLCVVATPFLVFIYAVATKNISEINRRAKYIIIFLVALCAVGGASLLILSNAFSDIPTVQHLTDAFSAEDERSVQKGFLIEGFKNYPIMGSGFGGFAGYVRSEIQPWLYELTYHQLLFNFGTIGIILLLSLFLTFLYLISKKITFNKRQSTFQFCIMIGFFAFLIGAYSNPYFLSFDFLIYIAMLPFLAAYKIDKNNFKH